MILILLLGCTEIKGSAPLTKKLFQEYYFQIRMSDAGDFELKSPRSKYVVHASGISEKVRVGLDYQEDIPNYVTSRDNSTEMRSSSQRRKIIEGQCRCGNRCQKCLNKTFRSSFTSPPLATDWSRLHLRAGHGILVSGLGIGD